MTALEDRLERLRRNHPKKIDLSLGRMQKILEVLGHPEHRLPPTIHVAGTNGKGSSCAYMRAMLEAQGLQVHVYTSPHLVDFRERIRICGRLIDEDILCDALDRVDAATIAAPLTFFEATTAAAFLAFSETPADALILEVGLGGRLDATNMLDAPIAAVITPVSHDHREFLGGDLAAIAGEKAGIAKRNCPLIVGTQAIDAWGAIKSHAQDRDALLYHEGKDWTWHADDNHLCYKDATGPLNLPLPGLLGAHQYANAILAVACLRHQRHLKVSDEAIAKGVLKAEWPARMQKLEHGRFLLYLDGGHNEAAAVAIAAFIEKQEQEQRPFHLILGLLKNKDIEAYLRPFKNLVTTLHAVEIDGETCYSTQEISDVATQLSISCEEYRDYRQALDHMQQRPLPKDSLVLIAGSLYLAGQVLKDFGWSAE